MHFAANLSLLHFCYGPRRSTPGRCIWRALGRELTLVNVSRHRCVWFAFALAVWVSSASGQDLQPSPELTPQEVVQVQVDALRRNDVPSPDAGIERSFRFASPSNRLATGPLAHFTRIVRSPAYSPLLNSISATVTESQVEGDEAKVLVQVVSASGQEVYYLFLLSKQQTGECNACWMTDAVLRLERERTDADQVAI
jgi:hypothetical protein